SGASACRWPSSRPTGATASSSAATPARPSTTRARTRACSSKRDAAGTSGSRRRRSRRPPTSRRTRRRTPWCGSWRASTSWPTSTPRSPPSPATCAGPQRPCRTSRGAVGPCSPSARRAARGSNWSNPWVLARPQRRSTSWGPVRGRSGSRSSISPPRRPTSTGGERPTRVATRGCGPTRQPPSGCRSSSSPPSGSAAGEELHCPLAHLDLPDLPGHGHRELIGDVQVARHLVVRQLPPAELAQLLDGQGLARLEPHPCHELLALALVGDPDDLHVSDRRVAVQELLDLARVDVLPAADHHVLDPPHDRDVAVVVHRRQVARVHPPGGVDRL